MKPLKFIATAVLVSLLLHLPDVHSINSDRPLGDARHQESSATPDMTNNNYHVDVVNKQKNFEPCKLILLGGIKSPVTSHMSRIFKSARERNESLLSKEKVVLERPKSKVPSWVLVSFGAMFLQRRWENKRLKLVAIRSLRHFSLRLMLAKTRTYPWQYDTLGSTGIGMCFGDRIRSVQVQYCAEY